MFGHPDGGPEDYTALPPGCAAHDVPHVPNPRRQLHPAAVQQAANQQGGHGHRQHWQRRAAAPGGGGAAAFPQAGRPPPNAGMLLVAPPLGGGLLQVPLPWGALLLVPPLGGGLLRVPLPLGALLLVPPLGGGLLRVPLPLGALLLVLPLGGGPLRVPLPLAPTLCRSPALAHSRPPLPRLLWPRGWQLPAPASVVLQCQRHVCGQAGRPPALGTSGAAPLFEQYDVVALQETRNQHPNPLGDLLAASHTAFSVPAPGDRHGLPGNGMAFYVRNTLVSAVKHLQGATGGTQALKLKAGGGHLPGGECLQLSISRTAANPCSNSSPPPAAGLARCWLHHGGGRGLERGPAAPG
jgi:hypothetical protein